MGSHMQISGNACSITLEGTVTLTDAEELKKTLIKALLDSDEISISTEKLEETDVSCLQLLCSAHRSAVRLKKRICFTGSPAEPFRAAVDAAGFGRVRGCKLDREKNCLWMAFSGARS